MGQTKSNKISKRNMNKHNHNNSINVNHNNSNLLLVDESKYLSTTNNLNRPGAPIPLSSTSVTKKKLLQKKKDQSRQRVPVGNKWSII